jgi:hypothetical protein
VIDPAQRHLGRDGLACRKIPEGAISEITHFIAVPFDFAGADLAAGEPAKCASPAAAIERAQGMWRVLGHAGAAALVRIGYPEGRITVLRTFGSVPEDFEV